MPRMDITAIPETVPGHQPWVIDIPVSKTQTYRYEFLPNGVARIYKNPGSDAPSYEVRGGLCSCPAANHGKRCKHVAPIVRQGGLQP